MASVSELDQCSSCTMLVPGPARGSEKKVVLSPKNKPGTDTGVRSEARETPELGQRSPKTPGCAQASQATQCGPCSLGELGLTQSPHREVGQPNDAPSTVCKPSQCLRWEVLIIQMRVKVGFLTTGVSHGKSEALEFHTENL